MSVDLEAMRLLIGIDDTDNLESRGTGYRARQLGRTLSDGGNRVTGISRHQLLVDPRIPYTSHNSAACLTVETSPDQLEAVVDHTRAFLARESAAGSDAGLCVAPADQVPDEVVTFGRQAKAAVVDLAGAHSLADRFALRLEGVTGTRIGAIGALAAVGLRASGDDGRVLWLDGLRELAGVWRVSNLIDALPGVAVETLDGRAAARDDRVALGDWVRPIIRGGRIVVLVEPDENNEREQRGTDRADQDIEWCVASRERIKQLSQ